MKQILTWVVVCAALFQPAHAQSDAALSAAFDSVLARQFPPGGPGVSVLVSRHGRIVYQKALGMANLELGVPLRKGHVFRIGSLTKQFTAIAILQLAEQGKLRLTDSIGRHLPAAPPQWAPITIEHLLTHTSGIRDFTSIKDSVQRYKLDVGPDEQIRYFKDAPLRFAPGSRYEYSNSNYFLLGRIIELVTGDTYRHYLENNLFRRAGMTRTYYGSDEALVPGRAAGYTKGEKGIENAGAISMTQPYAAGAILSTAEDLFRWQQAVNSYRLVRKETLEKAHTRYRLANGKESNYGYGWRLGYIQQSPSTWHGGLISGFSSMALYLPKEDVYVVLLANCDAVSPDVITSKLAAIAIGNPYTDTEFAVPPATLAAYAGVYENAAGEQRLISLDSGRLYAQSGRNRKIRAKATRPDRFFLDDPMITMEFSRSNGSVDKLTIWSRSGSELWTKTDKPLTTQSEIKLDEKVLARYTGQYEVNPHFSFVVSQEGARLFLQAAGQEKLELFAETQTKFFLKVNDAQLEFVEEGGIITKALLRQSGRSTEALKVK